MHPDSWKPIYQNGGQRKPVAASGPYGVEKDKYNRVAFQPVTTTALRVELQAQPSVSVGIQEWKVK